MDKKYGGHACCKVKMINIKNDLDHVFKITSVWTTSMVKMTFVMNLFIMELAMKLFKEVIPFSFMSQVNTF
jgi:hypothetical protein